MENVNLKNMDLENIAEKAELNEGIILPVGFSSLDAYCNYLQKQSKKCSEKYTSERIDKPRLRENNPENYTSFRKSKKNKDLSLMMVDLF